LIVSYGNAIREHGGATLVNLDDLLGDLHAAAEIRNVLCHGSWRPPDEEGQSVPFYVGKKGVFETPIDIAFLNQVRQHVLELACSVINSVIHMGWQFPGFGSPGVPIP
jgi:hypothetical protein